MPIKHNNFNFLIVILMMLLLVSLKVCAQVDEPPKLIGNAQEFIDLKKKISQLESKVNNNRLAVIIQSNSSNQKLLLGSSKYGTSFIGIPFTPIKLNPPYKEGSIISFDDEGDYMKVSNIESDKKVIGVLCEVASSKSVKIEYYVAIVGKVKVRVACNEKIEVGDLLVSSSSDGIATKAQSYDSSKGAIIGKALQPYNNRVGEGLITVLVTIN